MALMTLLLLAPAVYSEDLDAWPASRLMGMGVNIGNTLENTTRWETGWGNPVITKEFVDNLAKLGFKTVRLPVAWDTYAKDGRITADKLARVGEVVDWITAAGMYCVINIHWDGGWIDSSAKQRFPKTFATFSPEAESKYISYWTQIASYFAGRNEQLIFEALNEEGIEFGAARLTDIVSRERTGSARAIVDAIFETVTAFRGTRPQGDDMTAVAVKITA